MLAVILTACGGRSEKSNKIIADTTSEFCECENLRLIVFAEGTKRIGNYAFLNCKKLENISLPQSLEELGSRESIDKTLSGVSTVMGTISGVKEDYSNYNFDGMVQKIKSCVGDLKEIYHSDEFQYILKDPKNFQQQSFDRRNDRH